MHITDLFPDADLMAAVADGLVRVQTSPHGDRAHRIYNYTEQSVYTHTWTPVTRQCRGLIVDTAGRVVARPWAKFFNYGEHAADTLDLSAPVEVTDKADGSLGILHLNPDGHPTIATRGSFLSDQAVHATDLYRNRYQDRWLPAPGWTYLFEIVYPANRIVLDYGPMDDLILLGAVNIESGVPVGPNHDVCLTWPGPTADVHAHRTLADALAAEPRPNAEGLVVRYLDGPHQHTMLKLKQDDYVALHRVITGLTARRLWERAAVHAILTADTGTPPRRIAQTLHMDAGDVQGIIAAGPNWDDEVRKTAPEEFTDWIDATLTRLEEQVDDILGLVLSDAADWGGCDDRATIARGIADHPYRGMVFNALDGKPITAQAWAAVRPEAERPYAARGEDVA